MSSLNGERYAQSISGVKMMEAAAVSGKLRTLNEKYTILAILAVDDEILGPKLPKNCTVLDAYVRISSSLGETGIVSLGYKASSSGDTVEDADAFLLAVNAGGQAVINRPGDANNVMPAGIGKYFSESVQTFLKCTEVSTEATGVTLEWVIFYSID